MSGTNPDDRSPSVIDGEEDPNEKKKNAGECCKKFIKFLFSHIGLCGMVSAYCVAGGFIFKHLEATNEKTECLMAMNKYFPMENSTVYKVWEVAKTYGKDADDEEKEQQAVEEFRRLLEKFRQDVTDLGYSGDNCTIMGEPGGPEYGWSFPGALLFSVTVVTTIGYGNISPKTYWGRLVCIAYATLGIPLMLLCLANLGDVMADVFRYVYSKVCCCGCCRRKDKTKVESIQNENNPNENSPEAWKAGYNNQAGPVVVDDYEDDDEEYDDDERISVPLTITIAVIGFYIFMGALMFANFESWKAMDASYFCFITISTIGFGDMVPGSGYSSSSGDQWKMLVSAIYTLFGLALLSMCFSLIQEEIATKFKWVGEKLGIVEKDKDEEEEEEDEELDDGVEEIDPTPSRMEKLKGIEPDDDPIKKKY